jgi:hypothetical protein
MEHELDLRTEAAFLPEILFPLTGIHVCSASNLKQKVVRLFKIMLPLSFYKKIKFEIGSSCFNSTGTTEWGHNMYLQVTVPCIHF